MHCNSTGRRVECRLTSRRQMKVRRYGVIGSRLGTIWGRPQQMLPVVARGQGEKTDGGSIRVLNDVKDLMEILTKMTTHSWRIVMYVSGVCCGMFGRACLRSMLMHMNQRITIRTSHTACFQQVS